MSFRAKELHDIRSVHISEAFPSLESGHLYKKTIKMLSDCPVDLCDDRLDTVSLFSAYHGLVVEGEAL